MKKHLTSQFQQRDRREILRANNSSNRTKIHTLLVCVEVQSAGSMETSRAPPMKGILCEASDLDFAARCLCSL
jgi:hypothetical protein